MGTTVDGSEIRLTNERMVLKPYAYWDIYYINWCSISSHLCHIQYGSLKDQMCWCHYGSPQQKNSGFEYHHTSVENNSRYNKSLLHLEVEIVGVQMTVSPTLYCINPHGQYQHDRNPIFAARL